MKLTFATMSMAAMTAVLLAQPVPPPLPSLGQQTDLRTLSTAVRNLRRTATVSDTAKAQADKLIADAATAQRDGQSGESRRRLASALALLNGGTWDRKQEFAWSLALQPGRVVNDSSVPFLASFGQLYPAAYKPAGRLTLHVSLMSGGSGAAAHEIGKYDLPSRDYQDQPFGFDTIPGNIPDGAWQLKADVLDGDSLLVSLDRPVQMVQGIETQIADVERRLAKIQGHEGTKASVRYPYQLARVVNTGQRQFSAADFGIPVDTSLPPYDFVQGMRSSAELLKALESGKDPLFRAKGDHERHYWFEEAGEPMAYHLYAPMKWDGRSKLPMVLVLHGNTRDQDYYFDRDDRILAKLAEQHGFLVVTPMGYRPSAGWGSSTLRTPNAPPLAGAQLRTAELSEKDVLNVLDMVTNEYNVDPSRIYLFGHSAGGAGTWYMGQKYADKWAAIAASAAPTRPDGFPFEQLKGIPMMVCHGDKDDEVPVASSRNMVKASKEHGNDPVYVEVPGGTHLTIVALVEPRVFDFFDKHVRK